VAQFFEELKRRNVVRVGIAYLVVGWLIIEVIDTIAPRLGLPDWVPTFFIVVVLVGLPVALLVSWAFELTPEGLKKTQEVDESASITHSTGRKLDRMIIVALVLALGYFVWERQGLVEQSGTPAPQPVAAMTSNSVAVLPFVDLSPESDQEWFSDGLTEEILNSLTRLPELTVTARTSSFHFKGQNLPIQEIASKLGVAHIVEGSVRRAGDQLRITAQLIRAVDGFHLWSDTYDRSLEDVFAVQEDVAENVARALDIVLDAEKRERMFSTGTRSVEAYEAFQRGRVIFAAVHDDVKGMTLWQANALFEQAIAADPEYFLPHYFHRDALIHFVKEGPDGPYLAGGQPSGLTPEAALRGYQADMDQAIRLAPNERQRTLFEVERVQLSNDWRRLPALFERLEVMDASSGQFSTGGGWVGSVLLATGHPELQLRMAQEQLEWNPLDPFIWSEVNSALTLLERFDEAAAKLQEARERGIAHAFLDSTELVLYLVIGDDAALEATLARQPDRQRADGAMYLAALGRRDEARELMVGIVASVPYSENMIVAHMLLGNQAEADRLASEIDAMPLGSLRIQDVLYYTNWRFPFRIEAAPNYRARLLEAGVTEAEIAARHHPLVKAATNP
jgi:TolB-like protein